MAKMKAKETDELMLVLEEAAAAEKVTMQKEEAKIWGRSIPASRRLVDFLLKLTKDEMQEIAEILAAPKIKNLKKQELAERLTAAIIAAAQEIFSVLDRRQYEFFSNICQNKGITRDMTTASGSIPFFLDVGLVFPGTVKKERVLVMPAEIIGVFQKLNLAKIREKSSRNTEWIQLASGILFYYGVLTLEQLVEQMNGLTGQNIDQAELARVLKDNAVYTAGTMLEENNVFYNIRVFDYEQVQAEQRLRPEIWYYPITYEQAMAAGTENFVERTPAFEKLSEFIQDKYKADVIDVDNITAECAFAFRMGESVEDVLEYLTGMVDAKGSKGRKELMSLVLELANMTRQWLLKGYAPWEVRKTQNNISNVLMPRLPEDSENLNFSGKLGRNEPCLCGSGKKFKKCCGKAL